MFGCDDCNSSFLETAGISSFLARSFLVGASENCVCVSLSELALIVGTFGASALLPSSACNVEDICGASLFTVG